MLQEGNVNTLHIKGKSRESPVLREFEIKRSDSLEHPL